MTFDKHARTERRTKLTSESMTIVFTSWSNTILQKSAIVFSMGSCVTMKDSAKSYP